MRTRNMLLSAVAMLTMAGGSIWAQHTMDLSGDWQFQIDRHDEGISEKWYGKTLADEILLPGSMPQRLKGDKPSVDTKWTGSLYDSSFFYNPYMEKYRKIENFKLPFFLTPDRHYVGVAWYRRTVEIPSDWSGQRIVLFLERPHIETALWVNGKKVGNDNSLCVPHVYDDVETLADSGKLLSMDMVEVNPILDERNKTGILAAELIQSAFGKSVY